MVAQATSLHDALSELIADLIETIDLEQGGIGGVEVHGVMTGPDRCTIWGQACLDAPTPVVRLALDSMVIDQAPGAVSIGVTLRTAS